MILKYSIVIILFFSINLCFSTAKSPDSDINTTLEELVVEINKIEAFYENTNSSIATELKKVSTALLNTTKIEEQVTLLIKKEQLKLHFSQIFNTLDDQGVLLDIWLISNTILLSDVLISEHLVLKSLYNIFKSKKLSSTFI